MRPEGRPTPAVDGVVLAAGASRRMGSPKALLDSDGASFVERAVRLLRDGGCRAIVVVIRPGADRVGTAASGAGARVVVNPDESAEQIDSLRLALRNLDPGASAALVLPVDHPLVRPATVRALIDAHGRDEGDIVRPVHDGQPGHPTLFAAAVFDALYDSELERGAESVVESLASRRADLDVDDPGVVADIDTPEDYRARLGGP